MRDPLESLRPRRAPCVLAVGVAVGVLLSVGARADEAAATAVEGTAIASTAVDRATPADPPPQPPAPAHEGSFSFGSYGRVLAATDAEGRPARDTDIVVHGSRLDLDSYVELELRREDRWPALEAETDVVATLAVGSPLFHWNGEFDAKVAVRNLYFEERGLGVRGLDAWVGTRYVRGDNFYLLDFWPLDDQNTLGGGVRYTAKTRTRADVHLGFGRPDNPFYRDLAERPAPLGQFGTATVDLLDRQRMIGSARLEQTILFGAGPAGLKVVGYGEGHRVPAGEREAPSGALELVPQETGFVVGGEVGVFSGERDGFLNLFARYASGIAAYGAFAAPEGLGIDRSTAGAHELVLAAVGNYELGAFALQAGGYVRSFRNASLGLDFGDVDEGIVIARPQVWLADFAGLALEGSLELAQRGVLADLDPEAEASGAVGSSEPAPLEAHVGKVSVMPFLSPAGRGSFKRPLVWLAYTATFRDDGARMLYPVGDAFRARSIDHFFGLAAEWWFGGTSYGGH